MAEKKMFVFVLADLQSGGTQRVVSSLANYWSKTGNEVTVITLAERDSDFFKLSAAIKRIVIGGQRDSNSLVTGIVANISRIILIRNALKDLNARTAVGMICQTNILLVIAGLGLKTRIIISERNDPKRQSFGRAWDFLRRRIYPLADLVTANSREAVISLEAFVPKHKLEFLPNPVAFSSMNKDGKSPENRIIAVGRLHPQKAHDILISAFAKLIPKYPDWHLEILGEGDERLALSNLIKRFDLERSVTLSGRVENVMERLSRAKIFALPSRHEGTPNALLEAMAAGVAPVVSDASSGALEYVEHQINGLVVPVDDVDVLAKALCQLTENDKERQTYARKSISKVEHLSLPEVASYWESIIEQSR
jgi:GalNAc-alpha-(1->4)-GalNAc-alpha-(1->3)-diNAcBac-PP-undecaprenol alpha-1,4-N-acetyl-D-galactosaminyltransferase